MVESAEWDEQRFEEKLWISEAPWYPLDFIDISFMPVDYASLTD